MPATVMSRYSYPKVPGDGFWSIADITGPASYVPLGVADPPIGGQSVTAADFGLESLDWVGAMASDNAQYSVVVVPVPFNQGSPFAAVKLGWWVLLTNTQVPGGVNLSTRTVRLLAIGR